MDPELTVLEAKRYGIYSCGEGATLLEVAARMVEEDISCLVVVDVTGTLAGVISHTDLLRAHLDGAGWAAQPVSAYMSREVVTVPTDATLAQVGQLLLAHGIHRVVVVQAAGGRQVPVAVFASSDLVYQMVKGRGEL